MDVSTMITMLRDQTNTNSDQLSDTQALRYLNMTKNDFFSYLVTYAGENLNWDSWTTESIANQYEYVIPEAASDSTGSIKIDEVGITYDGETYENGQVKFVKARLVDRNSFQKNWNYYTEKQSKYNPIYYIADQSIFIAPIPDASEAGEGRIELTGIRNIPDWESTTAETNTKLPVRFHDVVVDGATVYVFKQLRQMDDANYMYELYRNRRLESAKEYDNRNQGPYYAKYPLGYNTNYSYEITKSDLN